jgi:dolichyl-diphosphooligosaccharide---protein glycosyltransferase
VIGNKDFDLTYLEEAYTTEHWLVRIYRVKKPHEFNRPVIKLEDRVVQSSDFVSRKVSKRSQNIHEMYIHHKTSKWRPYWI